MKIETERLAAASGSCPSRATKIMSTAPIAICSRLASASGPAMARVARSSARKGEGAAVPVMKPAPIGVLPDQAKG